jgi:hypothetical protein
MQQKTLSKLLYWYWYPISKQIGNSNFAYTQFASTAGHARAVDNDDGIYTQLLQQANEVSTHTYRKEYKQPRR